MGLSNDLISQFVKATNDEKKEPVETTVYGTIVHDGRTYVKLDGSDLLTPVSITADVKEGERVTVLIKNHTAIVTGNITSPSAGIQDVHNVQNKVEVNTEQIGAVNGRVDLNNAEIENLKATNAEIKNLMFDSATGKNLSVEFANMVVAQIGEAQIKSAMIESLTADKILGGSIYTNNVHVMSEDGNMIIADETIQISDGNRVRVQIGKDASDDYSINIWDADGKLMFSEGGLTDNAIKDAIIRDDMISDNANISAGKIDISSLFTEINGSEETINSTRIFLDNENQTLDVVFKSMTSDIEDIDNSVETLGTQLSITQGQIANKIWQQDIDDATGNLTSDFSEVKQQVDSLSATIESHTSRIDGEVQEVNDKVTRVTADLDGFRTSVSSTYVTKNDMENIKVGGRNLMLKSDFSDQTGNTGVEFTPSERMVTFTSTVLSDTKSFYPVLSDYALSKLRNSTITFSGEYKINTALQYGTANPWVGLQIGVIRNSTTGGDSQYLNWLGGNSAGTAVMDDWTKIVYTYEVTDYDFTSASISVLFRDVIGSISFRNLKIEFGNKATDWTPAPEDMATSEEVESMQDAIESNTTSISELAVSSEEIAANITRVETNTSASLESIGENISTLTEQVSAKVTPEDVQLTIKQELENGTAKVVTSTGYTFDDEGLMVSKTGYTTETQITHNGMAVYDSSANPDNWSDYSMVANYSTEWNNNDYLTCFFSPDEFLVEGEEYTVALNITPAPGVTHYIVHLSKGMATECTLYTSGTERQTIVGTFTAHYHQDYTLDMDVTNGDIYIYRLPNDDSVTTNSIFHWCKIKKGGPKEAMLTADDSGVQAKNLHATTYLIVGKNSRFEDYGGRTGCFWIGE